MPWRTPRAKCSTLDGRTAAPPNLIAVCCRRFRRPAGTAATVVTGQRRRAGRYKRQHEEKTESRRRTGAGAAADRRATAHRHPAALRRRFGGRHFYPHHDHLVVAVHVRLGNDHPQLPCLSPPTPTASCNLELPDARWRHDVLGCAGFLRIRALDAHYKYRDIGRIGVVSVVAHAPSGRLARRPAAAGPH